MKKSVKKIISLLLALVLLLSALSISAFAFKQEDFDINDLTLDDLSEMSISELKQVLADFERVYDPFDTYKAKQPLAEFNRKSQIQPLWTSGDMDWAGNYTEMGSHEVITMLAVIMLLNDINYTGGNEGTVIAAALTIGLASILPDRRSIGILALYAAHFYDPDTNKNYLGIGDTAKDNLIEFYNKALKEYKNNGDSEKFYEMVGRAVHYLQDACEPHHAANVTAVEHNGVHKVFEEYVNGYMDNFVENNRSFTYQKYLDMHTKSLEQLIYEPAKVGKSLINTVLDVNNKSQWNATMCTTVFNAIDYTSFVLFKMGVDSGELVPLY